MKNMRRAALYIFYFAAGAVLLVLGSMGIVDDFWSGMGAGFIAVGVLRLARMYRFKKDENYREAVETAMKDERNHFIRGRALAWAAYLFIIIAGASSIVFRIIGQEAYSLAASYAVCLILLLYSGAYTVLKRKY